MRYVDIHKANILIYLSSLRNTISLAFSFGYYEKRRQRDLIKEFNRRLIKLLLINYLITIIRRGGQSVQP